MVFSNHAQSNISLLSPTIFEISDEHYQQAKSRAAEQIAATHDAHDESLRWQSYLAQLGLLAFQEWLADNEMPSITSTADDIENPFQYLQLGEFRLGVLTTEHVLSEQVDIPVQCIQSITTAAHFYILLEVAEEQSEVWFRGLVRHDSLSSFMEPDSASSGIITIPLSALEPEPSRLLHYCRYLAPSSIPLHQGSSDLAQASTDITKRIESDTNSPASSLRSKLSDWLNNLADEAWQAWDSLQPQVAYATRGLAEGVKRGKLVNLGLEVGTQQVALVLTLTPEAEETTDAQKINILVQLLPTGSDRTLPPNLELSLISKKGKALQNIISRQQDNYIQLKSFKGKVGQQFGIKVTLGDAVVSEAFEI